MVFIGHYLWYSLDLIHRFRSFMWIHSRYQWINYVHVIECLCFNNNYITPLQASTSPSITPPNADAKDYHQTRNECPSVSEDCRFMKNPQSYVSFLALIVPITEP